MQKMINRLVIVLFILLVSCNNDQSSPKPFAYLRIDLPEAEYKVLEVDCPYSFEYSDQANIVMKDRSKCWINIYYPKNKATIYLTYVQLDGNLKEQLDQTQQLTYEHQIKANRIDRIAMEIDSTNVYGLRYRLEGDVASNVQFYLTDSTNNFIRGALYFEAYVNADSLRPIVDYLDKDIQHLMETFRWK
jgi:gliding motility-associated lipoprotein GldD